MARLSWRCGAQAPILSVDIESGAATRTEVCQAPRGMAYDADQGVVHVACAGGELITLMDDLSAPALRVLNLGNDLRDVVVRGDNLLVSHFRKADVLTIDSDGEVVNERSPRNLNGGGRDFSPSVAWRMVPTTNNNVLMLHQRGLVGEIPTGPANGPAYYGADCFSGIVHSALSVFSGTSGDNVSAEDAGGIGMIVLPVDAAVNDETGRVAIVGAGNNLLYTTSLDRARSIDRVVEGCLSLDPVETEVTVPGEPVAVAYSGTSDVFGANASARQAATHQPE